MRKIDYFRQSDGHPIRNLLSRVLTLIDRFMNWAYGSKYNPLYRSGTLTVGLLMIVSVTGLYLLFVYKISAPYESMVAIQNQVWAGRWIRALHRYASDAAVIALIIHILRTAVEGKAWGPRTLAWISGVFMTGIMFFSAWTGFVLVWDRAGQFLAIEGAKIMDLAPIFPQPLSRGFNGVTPILQSFFFMNLFLHVALPLGMTLALWIHTSKMARSLWLPWRPILVGITVALTLLSVFWPAPLAEGPDLLVMGGQAPLDFFFNWWLFVQWKFGAGTVAMLFFVGAVFLSSMPWWWKPAKEEEPGKSIHNEEKCEGCNQCAEDCPYDAIDMVPRKLGVGSELVADVNESLCVACGICSGSCSQFAIGPEDRSGRAQLDRVKKLRAEQPGSKVIFIYCENSSASKAFLSRVQDVAVPFSVECAGNLHTGTIASMMQHFSGVFILSCPMRACRQREGVTILEERMTAKRGPAFSNRVDKSKVRLVSAEFSDMTMLEKEFEEFAQKTGISWKASTGRGAVNTLQRIRALVVTAALLSGIAYFSNLPAGVGKDSSFLRVAFRLPGQSMESCHAMTPEEAAKLPMHMRRKEICETVQLKYALLVEVGGQIIKQLEVAGKGARGDRPIVVEEDLPIAPGTHDVRVKFAPINNEKAMSLEHSFTGEFRKNRAVLVGFDTFNQKVYHKE